MVEPVDYQAVVADLKARRARLDQLIAGFEAIILGQGEAVSPELEPGAPGANGLLPAAVHADTFFGLSLIEAAKKFLKMARRAQHTAAIADALGQGGLKRPDINVLSSILVRAAKGRDVTKVGKGMWGLAEWYPKRTAEPEEPPKKMQRATRKPKRGGKVTPASRPASIRGVAGHGNGKNAPVRGDLAAALREILKAANKPLHVRDITREVNARGTETIRASVEGQLNRWAKQGKVRKPAPGTFAL